MGRAAVNAVPVILKAVQRENAAQARAGLVMAAARIAPNDAAVLEALADRIVSGEAAKAPLDGVKKEGAPAGAAEIRLLAAAGSDAAPALRAGLRARSPAARCQIIALLAKLSQPDTDVVEDLSACLRDKNQDVRLAAVQALGGFGPAAAKAHWLLRELAQNDPDPALRRAAELAALNAARSPNQPAYHAVLESRPDAEVLAALKDPDPAVRQEAAVTLRTRRTYPAIPGGRRFALGTWTSSARPLRLRPPPRSLTLCGTRSPKSASQRPIAWRTSAHTTAPRCPP